jgi:hypothetical protein
MAAVEDILQTIAEHIQLRVHLLLLGLHQKSPEIERV